MKEDVIKEFSHRDHGTARIVSTFVVGDSDDEAKTQSEDYDIRDMLVNPKKFTGTCRY
jgi:hypothetical protein